MYPYINNYYNNYFPIINNYAPATPPPQPVVTVVSATTPEQPPMKVTGDTWSHVKRSYQHARGKKGPRTQFALFDEDGKHLPSPQKVNNTRAVFAELSKVDERPLHSGLVTLPSIFDRNNNIQLGKEPVASHRAAILVIRRFGGTNKGKARWLSISDVSFGYLLPIRSCPW